MDYLSNEEQFKEILNNEEINRIRDPKLRAIRFKYWGLRHKAFLDEKKITDSNLMRVWDELIRQEQEEIQRFKNG